MGVILVKADIKTARTLPIVTGDRMLRRSPVFCLFSLCLTMVVLTAATVCAQENSKAALICCNLLICNSLTHLSQLAGSAATGNRSGLHRGQKVCTTRAMLVCSRATFRHTQSAWRLKMADEVTSNDCSHKSRAGK